MPSGDLPKAAEMKSKKRKSRGKQTGTFFFFSIFALITLCYILGCSPKTVPPPPDQAKPAAKGTFRPYTIKGKTYHPLNSAVGFEEVGYASWYGPSFHGRKTSNGEVYNMEAMTAAHKTLPMNTWVSVTNLNNNRKAIVRVNDRGPFVDGRVIDLSKRAARRLGVIGPGTAKVRLVALGYKKAGTGRGNKPAKYIPPASYQTGPYAVQVGAFTNESNAWRLAASLRVKWQSVRVIRFDRGDKVFFRVWVGKTNSLAQAGEMQAKLRSQGFKNAYAVAW